MLSWSLGKEEKAALELLKSYRALEREQVKKTLMLPLYGGMTESGADSIIYSLQKRELVYTRTHEGIPVLAASYMDKPDFDVIKAYWTLLMFAGDIGRENHTRAEYPASIYFIREDREYKIVVVHDENALNAGSKREDEDTEPIFVVPDRTVISKFQWPEDARLFAEYKRKQGDAEPAIKIFKKGV